MSRAPFFCLLSLVGVLAACSDSAEEAPPAQAKAPKKTLSNVAVNPKASWLSDKQKDTVEIQQDRLLFSATGNDALLKKKAGDILVSDRSTKGNNPDGFMRKVVSVAKEGGKIVVTTEQAYLTEVIVGEFDLDFDNDELRFMTAEEIGGTAQSFDFLGGPGLRPAFDTTVGLDLTYKKEDVSLGQIKVPAFEIELNKGWKVGVSGQGSLKVKEAMFSLKPSVNFGGKIEVPGGFFDKFDPSNYLEELHLKFKGEAGAKVVFSAEAALQIEAGKKLTKESGADNLANSIASKLTSLAKPGTLSTPIVPGTPFVGPPIPTPFGPIPVTYMFEMDLVCGATLAGSAEFQVGWEASALAEFGFVYEKDKGTRPISNTNFTFNKIGPNLTKISGSLEGKCALEPKLLAKIAGFAGPFVKGSAGAAIKFEGAESCEGIKDGKPKPTFTVSTERTLGLYMGAEAGFKIGPIDIKLFEGQVPVYERKAKIFPDAKFDLPESVAVGYCSGENLGQAGAGGAGGSGQGGSGTAGSGAGGSGQGNNGGSGPSAGSGQGNNGGSSASGGSGQGNNGGSGQGNNGGSGQGNNGGSSQNSCGNGKLDSAVEFCDGSDFGGKTCADLLSAPQATGSPTCRADCTIDTSTCNLNAACGDVCTESDKPQTPDCGSCQQKVCQVNPYCCENAWDITCIDSAKSQCGMCN